MRDGDIDYSAYTLRELEEALAGIDRRQYPKNAAALRTAYERLTSKTAPTPPVQEPALDPPGERRPPPRYDEHGRYIPNQIDGMERVNYLAFSVLLLAYGIHGVWVNDLYLPGRRYTRGTHLHDSAAWLLFGAIACACLVMLSVIADHYDRRNNERNYRVFAATFRAIGWTLLVLSLVFDLVFRYKAMH